MNVNVNVNVAIYVSNDEPYTLNKDIEIHVLGQVINVEIGSIFNHSCTVSLKNSAYKLSRMLVYNALTNNEYTSLSLFEKRETNEI